MVRLLREDENNVVQALRRLEYVHLEDKHLNMKLLTELTTGNYDSLPTRKIVPLLEELARPRQLKEVREEQSHIEKIVEEYLHPEYYRNLLSNFKRVRIG